MERWPSPSSVVKGMMVVISQCVDDSGMERWASLSGHMCKGKGICDHAVFDVE
jgi:hypothetical protein